MNNLRTLRGEVRAAPRKAVALLLTIGLLVGCSPAEEERQALDLPPAAESPPTLDVEAVIRQVRAAQRLEAASPVSAQFSAGPEFGMDEPLQGIIPLEGNQIFPSVASDGSQFLVVWQDSRGKDIYGARVSQEGILLDLPGFTISTANELQMQPAVAFNGTHFLVVWSDLRTAGRANIYGARVAADGSVLDPDGFAISTALGVEGYAAVACRAGAECLVVWDRGRNIHGARVLPDGSVLDGAGGIAIAWEPAEALLPSVATNGAGYLVAWQRNPSGSGAADIYARHVLPDGTLPAPAVAIASAVDDQIDPTVASDGTDYLVAWADRRGGVLLDMYTARVDATGNVLNPGGAPLGSQGHSGYPAAGFDGTHYLVTWFSAIFNEGINAARVSRNGTVLDRTLLTGGTSRKFPAVAHAGDLALVVWEQGGSTDDVRGTRVSAGGTALDPSSLLVTAAYNGISNRQRNASVGFGGNQFLVVWEDFRNGTTSDLYGTRVAADGTLLDPTGIALSTAPGHQRSARIAYDGTRFLVIWEDQRQGNWDIYGARVEPDGTVLDVSGIPIAASSRDELHPELAFGGGLYLVVWDEHRPSATTQGVFAARVATDGTVLSPSSIALSSNLFGKYNPAVAFDGTHFLVVWEDYRGSYLTGWEIYGTRVSPSGSVLDLFGLEIRSANGQQTNPAVAFDGNNYLVVWQHDSTSGSTATDLHGTRVSPGGKVLGAFPISEAAYAQHSPTIVFDGQDFVVAWQDGRAQTHDDIYAARVRSDGTVADPSGVAIAATSSSEQAVSLATDGAGLTLSTYHRHDAAVPYQTERARGRFLPRP